MNEHIETLETRFVEAMARFAKGAGIVGVVEGRLLGRLILAGRPLTQDDLMTCTGVSRGRVSMALKELAEGGFIRPAGTAGSRRVHYEAQANLWRVTIGFVLARIGREILAVHEEFLAVLEEGRRLSAQGPGAAEKLAAFRLVRQVERLTAYTDGARKLMAAVQKLVEREKT